MLCRWAEPQLLDQSATRPVDTDARDSSSRAAHAKVDAGQQAGIPKCSVPTYSYDCDFVHSSHTIELLAHQRD